MQFVLNNCFYFDGHVEIIMNGETGSGLATATIAQTQINEPVGIFLL